MQGNSKIPLAFVYVGNSVFHIYSSLIIKKVEVTVYEVIPNDYTGTRLENVFPPFEQLVYSFSYRQINEIESVRATVANYFNIAISSSEACCAGTRFNSAFGYYSQKNKGMIDVINSFSGLAAYSQWTTEMILEKYPDAILIPVINAIPLIEEANTSQVASSLTEEMYQEALTSFSVKDLVRRKTTESFKLSAHFTGQITSIYARIGDEYFQFYDRASLNHDQIIQKTLMLVSSEEFI